MDWAKRIFGVEECWDHLSKWSQCRPIMGKCQTEASCRRLAPVRVCRPWQECENQKCWVGETQKLGISLSAIKHILLSRCIGSGWAGVDFPLEALSVLCFAWVAGKVLITHPSFGSCWVVLAQPQLCLSTLPHPIKGLGMGKVLGGDTTRRADPN